jgi:hypothetical protein
MHFAYYRSTLIRENPDQQSLNVIAYYQRVEAVGDPLPEKAQASD